MEDEKNHLLSTMNWKKISRTKSSKNITSASSVLISKGKCLGFPARDNPVLCLVCGTLALYRTVLIKLESTTWDLVKTHLGFGKEDSAFTTNSRVVLALSLDPTVWMHSRDGQESTKSQD